MDSANELVQQAEEIADDVLFPAALGTDASSLAPLSHLDLLASRGLYGLAGPKEFGGLEADLRAACAVIEALAGGCLTTTFVWIQHHSSVRALASARQALREEWLARLCAGEVRAGIALGGLRPGPSQLRAVAVEGGWIFDGGVPYVSGWGRIDVMLTAALTGDGRIVRALVDATTGDSLAASPLRLVAANASGTVEVAFRQHFVAEERVVSVDAYTPPPPYDGGGRFNGSLALGVANRCCRLIGPSGLDDELSARRAQLDAATDETMAAARAAAAELALRSAAALIVAQGSHSIWLDAQAQRLAREALFLLVFGSRPAIRDALMLRLGVEAATPS